MSPAASMNLRSSQGVSRTKGYGGTMSDHDNRTPHDTQLLTEIAGKSQESLSALYDRFSKLLYGLILAIVRDTDDAEDILQEVFIQVWKSASTYQPALGSPKTWLVRLAHNRAIDLLRSKRHRQKQMEVREGVEESGMDMQEAHAEDGTWNQTVAREQTGFISTALSRLPREQQILIELAFLQGYTHQEIARNTGLPLGTVKTRIRSAMQALRTRLRFVAQEI